MTITSNEPYEPSERDYLVFDIMSLMDDSAKSHELVPTYELAEQIVDLVERTLTKPRVRVPARTCGAVVANGDEAT